MCAAKKGGRKSGSRRSGKLSKTKSTLRDGREVEHLDWESELHVIDVASAERQRAQLQALHSKQRLSSLDPEPEMLPAEAETDLLESLYKDSDNYERDRKVESTAHGLRPDLATNIWFGDAGAGHDDGDGHNGSAVVMEGVAWQKRIMEADRHRQKWKDESGKARKAIGLETLHGRKRYPWELDFSGKMSGKLGKIYARLPPWTVGAAWEQIDREILITAVTNLVVAFQGETGKRVMAASIHVETTHDIHVHLIFTGLIPEPEEHKFAASYAPKKQGVQRELIRASLREKGIQDASLKLVNQKLEEYYRTGLLEDPRITNYRSLYRSVPKCVRPLKSMGPSYCSKTNLWEASGRDEKVEAVNARAVRRVSFGEIVVNKSWESPGKAKSAGDTYIDFWLWRRWRLIFESLLDEETQAKLPELSKQYVERYVRDGDSLPNPQLDAERTKAYCEVFRELSAAQAGLADPEDAPSVAASLPDLIDEIGEIVRNSKQQARDAEAQLDVAKVALESAWDEISEKKEPRPDISTVPGWVEEIRKALEKKISSAAVAAFQLAHQTLFPGDPPLESRSPADSQDELANKVANERYRLENLEKDIRIKEGEITTAQLDIAHTRMEAEKERNAAANALSSAHEKASELHAPLLTRESNAAEREKRIEARETVLAVKETSLEDRQSRLSEWAKLFKSRLRRRLNWRVSKITENVSALVLGKQLFTSLKESEENPNRIVRREVARLRRAEKVLAKLVLQPSKAPPNSELGKLLASAKAILASNKKEREKKAPFEQSPEAKEIGGS